MESGKFKALLMQETAKDRTQSHELLINSEATKHPLTRKVRRETRVSNGGGHSILEKVG